MAHRFHEPRPLRYAADDLPTTYVSYDLETSGLGVDARIVEFGAIRVIGGAEDERFSTLVSLPEGYAMEPGAMAVNHITPAMLEGAPTLREAFGGFCDFVEDLPLVGQNIRSFDNRFVDAAAAELGMRSPTENGSYDTMLIYRELVGKPSNLAAICAHYGVDNEEAHRAWADARATSDCYLALIRDLRSRRFEAYDPEAGPVAHELDGQLMCFTGNTYDFPKREMELLALAHGAQVRHDVIRRTTMVVALSGEPSKKLARAHELGCAVVSGDDFLALIGLTSTDLRR